MVGDTTPGPAAAHDAGPGYEPRDINARGTAFVLAGIAGTTVLAITIVFVMIWRFDVSRQAAWSQLTPEQTAQPVPPAPNLQVDPFADLAKLRAREAQRLDSYGWTSADHSTARIPIDRAMVQSIGKSLDAPP
jgi:hypothetical protein